MRILLILPRRGLFQFTSCSQCRYLFECEQCDAHLVTYREQGETLSLLCHQCQRDYRYPNQCPQCGSMILYSRGEGIEKLEEICQQQFQKKVVRLDTFKSYSSMQKALQKEADCYLTTRVFDPSIDYTRFDKVIFLQADSLLMSPDYNVQEEIILQLYRTLSSLSESTSVIFDGKSTEGSFYQELYSLGTKDLTQLRHWLIKKLDREHQSRSKYLFPPEVNILLLTTQEKNKDHSTEKIQELYRQLKKKIADYPELTLTTPYPAKFLKRKGYYSHHVLLRFPRNFPQFSLLYQEVVRLVRPARIQTRLNPRHVF